MCSNESGIESNRMFIAFHCAFRLLREGQENWARDLNDAEIVARLAVE
jgi:hypothetical protein